MGSGPRWPPGRRGGDHTRADDAALLGSVRAGDDDAYAELWRRHSAAAHVAARNFTSIAEPDDLVAEAYARILTAIRRGNGPVDAFRPYLYATLRNVARALSHNEEPVLVEDFDVFTDPASASDPEGPAHDRTVEAFRSLPPRWQSVLWYSEVEGLEPRELAPLLQVSPNSAAALAYRAREGLRQAWLQAHVEQDGVAEGCRWTRERLARYERGALSKTDAARVASHLDECDDCSAVVADLRKVAIRLPAVLAPLILGGTTAAAFAASLRSEGAAVAATPGGSPGPAPSSGSHALGIVVAGAALAAAGMGVYAIASGMSATPPPAVVGESETVPTTPTTSPPPAETPSPAPSTPPTDEPTAEPDPPLAAPPPVVPPPPVPAPQPVPSPTPTPTGPPADTTAEPPVVTTVLDPASPVRPRLEGTAEPGATVTVRDDTGAALATVTADTDGAWSTETLTTLAPTATALSVVQVDRAGNTSEATVLEPLGFVPRLDPPGPEYTCSAGDSVYLDAEWWDGADVVIAVVEGGTLELFFTDSTGFDYYAPVEPGTPFTLPATDGWTDLELFCDTPRSIAFSLGYADAAASTERLLTID